MITVTKIFSFEMAHAIVAYDGPCCHIHGHSYILHVTVATCETDGEPLPAPGFVIDFKALKSLVQERVIGQLDHALVLSEAFIGQSPDVRTHQNLFAWEMEPSAENMLYYIRHQLNGYLPEGTRLQHLRLFETASSYAEWTAPA